eukprot:385186_1
MASQCLVSDEDLAIILNAVMQFLSFLDKTNMVSSLPDFAKVITDSRSYINQKKMHDKIEKDILCDIVPWQNDGFWGSPVFKEGKRIPLTQQLLNGKLALGHKGLHTSTVMSSLISKEVCIEEIKYILFESGFEINLYFGSRSEGNFRYSERYKTVLSCCRNEELRKILKECGAKEGTWAAWEDDEETDEIGEESSGVFKDLSVSEVRALFYKGIGRIIYGSDL